MTVLSAGAVVVALTGMSTPPTEPPESAAADVAEVVAPAAEVPESVVPESVAPEPTEPSAPDPAEVVAPEPEVVAPEPEVVAPASEPTAPAAPVPAEPVAAPAGPVAGTVPPADAEPALTAEPAPDPAGPASVAAPVGAADATSGDPATGAARPSGPHEPGNEGADLTVTKTVDALTPSYGWALEKAVLPPDRQGAGSDHVATFAYEVTVSAVAGADLWTMSGDITVTNPNTWDVVADVTDTTDLPGATCSVTGGTAATVPAEGSLTLDYGCTLAGPATGTNTATASWDAQAHRTPTGTASGSVVITEDMWSETAANETVTVRDDGGVLTSAVDLHFAGVPQILGVLTWEEGLVESFGYELTFPGKPGTCIEFTNTAWLEELPTVSDSAVVTVCRGRGLQVDKTAEATFDRTYLWEITKDVDVDSVTLDADGDAEFRYTVTATPAGHVDDGWSVTGVISVTNPNDFRPVGAVTVIDTTDVGGTCTVYDADGVPVGDRELEMPAATTWELPYECVFDGAPDLATPGVLTGTNTVTVTWVMSRGETGHDDGGHDDGHGDVVVAVDDGHEGGSGGQGGHEVEDGDGHEAERHSATAEADFVFTLDQVTDDVITVWDDRTDPDHPVVLGTTGTGEDGEPLAATFEYDLALAGTAGRCVGYTNVAWIEETGQEATASAEVCVDAAPVLPPPPPAIPTVRPVVPAPAPTAAPAAVVTVTRPARQLPTTGTETAGLGAVGLLLTLGGTALYAASRRRTA
ncbi:LPXTG cell wall anchor domain-containing protein [Georgenia sp. M64]|uniref:LPXTG cell wall anchor domain-containing protein n=1 Tax=Georgenia sp. M64 TaxID=3120520 RepID=UPI0030E4FFD0